MGFRMLLTVIRSRRPAETSPASLRARASDALSCRPTISWIMYPASRSESARAVPNFPAPTMAIVGFEAMLRQDNKNRQLALST
jgi:hypothetical protein